MRRNGKGRADAKRNRCKDRRSDDGAVNEVVKGVAHEYRNDAAS